MAMMQARSDILVRPLVESDLGDAARILCVAFGTFLGLADPQRFLGDADMVRSRWRAQPSGVLAAEHNGKLVGSNFIANWGSFGFFGPLTTEPEYWNRGVAQRLLVPTMEIFKRWGTRHMGLYTFADSPKHLALYQKFGFWPRDLVALMAKPVGERPDTSVPDTVPFSAVSPEARPGVAGHELDLVGPNGKVAFFGIGASLDAFGVEHSHDLVPHHERRDQADVPGRRPHERRQTGVALALRGAKDRRLLR